MSLTVIKDLPDTLLTKNPAELILLKRGVFTTAGEFADHFLLPDLTTWNTGETWTLAWGSKAHAFTLTSDVTEDTEELPSRSGYLVSDTDYINDLAEWLNNVPILTDDFYIEAVAHGTGLPRLRLRAKFKGSDYTITNGGTVTFAGGGNIIRAGVDAVKADDYRVRVDVMAEADADMLNYEIIKTLEGTGEADEVTNTMEVAFHDFPALLQKYYRLKPPIDPYSVTTREKLLRKWKYAYREFYGGKDYKKTIVEGDRYIQHAGLDMEHAGQQDFDFNPQFFTNQPRVKVISRNQPEWLGIFVPATKPVSTISLKAYNTMGGIVVSGITWKAEWYDKLLLIPAGCKQLRFESTGLTVTHYTIQLVDGGTQRSDLMTYIVDPRHYRDEKYLVFENSWGCFDTLRVRGEQELILETTQEIAEHTRTSETRMEDGLQSMTGKFDSDKWKLNTGHIAESELPWLNDLLRSENVWEGLPVPDFAPSWSNSETQRYKKMIITSKKHAMDKSDSFRWAVEIEAQYAWEDNSVSVRGKIEEQRIRPDKMEWVLHNTASGVRQMNLNLNTDVKNVRLETNGREDTFTGVSKTISMAPGETVRMTLRALNLKDVTFIPLGHSHIQIIYREVPMTLVKLAATGINNFESDYWVNRLRYFKNLETFAHNHLPNVRDTDALLRELMLNMEMHGKLIHANLGGGSAPSAAGTADKLQLEALGVEVLTT